MKEDLSTDFLARCAGRGGGLVAEELFSFFGEIYPICFPEICVAGWASFWSFG